MENKNFQIDANIVSNRKKSNKSTNKNSTNRKPSKKSNFFLFTLLIIGLIAIALFFWIKDFNEKLIKDFSDGKIIVCKDRLVSKELAYVFNKNENAFVNKKDGLFFSIYYCSGFDK